MRHLTESAAREYNKLMPSAETKLKRHGDAVFAVFLVVLFKDLNVEALVWWSCCLKIIDAGLSVLFVVRLPQPGVSVFFL